MATGLLASAVSCAPGAESPRATTPPAEPNPPALSEEPPLHGEQDPLDAHGWQFRLSLSHAAPVAITCEEDGGRHERHRLERPAATDHAVTIRGLKADTAYTCVAELTDGSSIRSQALQLRTPPLPPGLIPPEVTVSTASPVETGYTVFNYGLLRADFSYISPHLVIIDAEGNVRWRYEGVGGGDIDVNWLGDGQLIYGGYANGYFAPTILDLDKAEKFVATSATNFPYEQQGTFNHDADLSEDGSSLFTFVKTGHSDGYKGFVVKEIDLESNTPIWIWDSETDGVGSGVLERGSAQNFDPYHNNSVQDRWEEGRRYVYVGLRNLHQVFKIDYATKAVVWKLGIDGDFTLLEPDGSPAEAHRWFFYQHDAQRHGDLMTFYDNGVFRYLYGALNYSRALKLELDEARRTARIVFEWTEPNWLEPGWGGFDLLENGNGLIALGHCELASGYEHPSALIELDPAGEVVWRADWSNLNVAIYRADRIAGCDIFSNVEYCPDLEP